MNGERIAIGIQVTTGIAVVLGLVLVVWELRQAKSLALAELTSQAYSEVLAESRTVMGDHPAVAISKACQAPESLTNEDLVILNAFYTGQVTQIWRLRMLEEIEDFGVPWQSIARERLLALLSTPHGRWWFAENVARDAKLAAIGEEVLALDPSCTDYFDRFGARTAPSP